MNNSISEVYWQDVRDAVKSINIELYHIIEEIDPPKNFSFIKAHYNYGDLIVDHGIPQLPMDSTRITPLHCSDVSNKLRRKLNYSPIPVGLSLNKSSEIFINSKKRIIPLKLLRPGDLIGVNDIINVFVGYRSKPTISISSGSRSIFTLAKISELTAHRRLNKFYRIHSEAPKDFSQHWNIFKKIVSGTVTNEEKWQNVTLFFTANWFNKARYKHDKDWLLLYRYLIEQAWLQAQNEREDTDFNLMWQTFSSALAKRNLRPRLYLINTIKHLLNIARGLTPGFHPISDRKQLVAPTNIIQAAYVEVYGLKHYLPTLMCASDSFFDESTTLYYSLAFPTLFEAVNHPRPHVRNIINDQRDIQLLWNILQKSIVHCDSSAWKHRIKNILYRFYHTDQDLYGVIEPSSSIPKHDWNMLYEQQYYPDRKFCDTSHFWRGCISTQASSFCKAE